jgi:hypothetical protein
MSYGDMLPYFGWAVIFGCFVAVLVPYLFFKQELATLRNALIGGCVPFIGSSTIALANGSQEPYATYLEADYRTFVHIFLVFFITFLVAYQFYKPARITYKPLMVRTNYSDSLPIIFAILALVFGIFNFSLAVGLSIPVVSQAIVKIGPASSAFGAVFAIGSWARDRTNPLKLALMIAVIGFCLILAVMSGGGRRNFLAVVITLPLFFYWETLRTKSRIVTTIVLLVAAGAAFVVLAAYSEVRHFDRGIGAEGTDRDFKNSVEALKKLPMQMLKVQDTLGSPNFHKEFGQNPTNCSLYLITKDRKGGASQRVFGEEFPKPFHALQFVIVNPVPRAYWPDKPESLGYILPKDYNPRFRVNWGPGIVGRAVFEGGMIMAVFYGMFIAVILKTIDTALINNSRDLFLLGMVAAIMPQVVMLVRGDMGIVLLNIIFGVIYYFLTKFLALRLYGRSYAKQA